MCVYLRTKFQVSKQTPKKSTKISVKRFQGNKLLSQLAKLVNIFDKLSDTLPPPAPTIFFIKIKSSKFLTL